MTAQIYFLNTSYVVLNNLSDKTMLNYSFRHFRQKKKKNIFSLHFSILFLIFFFRQM